MLCLEKAYQLANALHRRRVGLSSLSAQRSCCVVKMQGGHGFYRSCREQMIGALGLHRPRSTENILENAALGYCRSVTAETMARMELLKAALPETFSIALAPNLPVVAPDVVTACMQRSPVTYDSATALNYKMVIGQDRAVPAAWALHPAAYSFIAYTLRVAAALAADADKTERVLRILPNDPVRVITSHNYEAAVENAEVLAAILGSFHWGWSGYREDRQLWRDVDRLAQMTSGATELIPWSNVYTSGMCQFFRDVDSGFVSYDTYLHEPSIEQDERAA